MLAERVVVPVPAWVRLPDPLITPASVWAAEFEKVSWPLLVMAPL